MHSHTSKEPCLWRQRALDNIMAPITSLKWSCFPFSCHSNYFHTVCVSFYPCVETELLSSCHQSIWILCYREYLFFPSFLQSTISSMTFSILLIRPEYKQAALAASVISSWNTSWRTHPAWATLLLHRDPVSTVPAASSPPSDVFGRRQN